MLEGVSLHNPVFVNTLGHTFGLLIFGFLIVLLVRGWDRSGRRQRTAAMVALCLAFGWNLGSLIGLGATDGNGEISDALIAINFSILSLLPAVLLAVVLHQRYRPLVRIGYALSIASVILHFAELWLPASHLHDIALLLISGGFGALLIALLILSVRSKPRTVALTDLVCLLLFTASFLHFGYGHSGAAWTNEITWHHASIPLALIVLLRDYRLLVLETFARFVANVLLAGLFAGGLYWLFEGSHILEYVNGHAFTSALLSALFCCLLVFFADVRAWMQTRLSRSVFPHGDLNLSSKQILLIAAENQSERELLERGAAQIGNFVDAEKFEIIPRPALLPERSRKGRAGTAEQPWGELELPLRLSRGDGLVLVLGPRRGSRRYLTEDLDSLQQLTSLLVEQVERFRANELQRLAHEAELRALQAQVNPHFLFNALNTLYGTISRESFQARRLVLNLAELFRYCLQRDRTLIPLGEELQIVQAYLEIESLRLGNRLNFELTANPEVRRLTIPVLSIQPIVENAIKHGISRLSSGGHVAIAAKESDGMLRVTVSDNGPGWQANSVSSGLGMGLENVRKRLRLCYGDSSVLSIESTRDGCRVSFCVPIDNNGSVRSRPEAAHIPAKAAL
jgi:hypothetical protein